MSTGGRSSDLFFHFHFGTFSTNREDRTFRHRPLEKFTGKGGLDFGRGLVGLHDINGFITPHHIAWFFDEFNQEGFLESFTHLRNSNRYDWHSDQSSIVN
jgi:hypothetical protein